MRSPDEGFETYEDQVHFEHVQRMKLEEKKLNYRIHKQTEEMKIQREEENASAFILYGNNVHEKVLDLIGVIKVHSNIRFDHKFIELGISFFVLKCEQILKGEKKMTTLENLLNESFGEAAVMKYNVQGGAF